MKRLLPALLLCLRLAAEPAPLTLREAVERALKSYPAMQVSLEQLKAAAAAINLSRTSYLPRVDLLGQWNRATRNNVFGLLLPQTVIPAISGPPRAENDLTSVWGSAAGILVTWEPFDFGLREANVQIEERGRERASASLERTRFEVATMAADAFLTILAAEQTAVAAKAGVERAKVLSTVVDALVKSQLRPGADAARSRAELAVAQTQLIQAQQAVRVARTSLAQFLGVSSSEIVVEPGPLLEAIPESSQIEPVEHPLMREQSAAIEEARARQKALDRAYYPRLFLQGATYGRGTGANPNGTVEGGAAGLGPNIFNYGVGLTVTFPVFDLPAIRARREIESHRERMESARYEQLRRELKARKERALAEFDSAQQVAEVMPHQLEAARAAEQQATARYRAGLGTIAEVAEAQRLLTQAEIDNSLARLNVWRAMLNVAAAEGDLEPFLAQGSR